jgi:hypothetical protein
MVVSMLPFEEEIDPMDAVLALADLPTQQVAPEMDRPLPAMPQMPAVEPKQMQPSERSTGGSKMPIGPGRVDPGLAFMAAFSQNPMLTKLVDQQRNAPREQAAEQRAQEKWQLERDLMTPLKAEGMRGKNAMQGRELEALDPRSPYSQQMRQSISQGLLLQAQRMRAANPELAATMEKAAAGLGNNDRLSAKQAMDVAKNFAGIGDKVVSDAHKSATLSETQRMNDAKIGHWAKQDANALARISAIRNRPQQQSARERAANAKLQEKLDDEIEKAEWAKNILLGVADIKQQVNTGPLAGRIQNAAQMFDLAPDAFNKLKSRLTMVSNRIIKELSGSAVTGNEWQRMQDELANILNDDRNFESKLADMIELTESIKQRAINRYARVDGAPSNATNTAARVTAGKPSVRAGETPPPDATPHPKMKAPPGKAPGSMIRQKSTGKVFRVTADGMLEEVK